MLIIVITDKIICQSILDLKLYLDPITISINLALSKIYKLYFVKSNKNRSFV